MTISRESYILCEFTSAAFYTLLGGRGQDPPISTVPPLEGSLSTGVRMLENRWFLHAFTGIATGCGESRKSKVFLLSHPEIPVQQSKRETKRIRGLAGEAAKQTAAAGSSPGDPRDIPG
jgi:hypothetical protein